MTDAEADLLDTLRIVSSVTACPPDVVKLACESSLFAVIVAKLLYVRKLCDDTINLYGGTDGGPK